ncbi:pentatricopeptide repeat-containing protein, partial [Tanacetum coccineum]
KERKKGWDFLRQMDRRNIKRNAETYRCILSGCESENEIIKYNLQMKREGVLPTLRNYESLIKACANCRSFEKAKEVLLDLNKTMSAEDLNELRNTLVSTLAIYDQTDDAFQAYEEIKNANHHVKPQTTKMLIVRV